MCQNVTNLILTAAFSHSGFYLLNLKRKQYLNIMHYFFSLEDINSTYSMINYIHGLFVMNMWPTVCSPGGKEKLFPFLVIFPVPVSACVAKPSLCFNLF